MNRARANFWLFWGSVVLCFILQLMPLPQAFLPLKPYWLALVLAYWVLEMPDRVGLGLAFILGLCGDVIAPDLLGENAMRLCILCFILLRFRARLRFFPMWQQALAILALLLNDRIVVLMVRACAGEPPPPAAFWLEPVTGALAWPWVFLLLDDLRARVRTTES
jgi:rod shape-determining protein MreD